MAIIVRKTVKSTNALFRRRSRTADGRREIITGREEPRPPAWPLAILMAGVAVSLAWSLFLAWSFVEFARWLIG